MMDVVVMEGPDGKSIKGRINQVLTFQGLERVQTKEAGPGSSISLCQSRDLKDLRRLVGVGEPGKLGFGCCLIRAKDEFLIARHCVAYAIPQSQRLSQIECHD